MDANESCSLGKPAANDDGTRWDMRGHSPVKLFTTGIGGCGWNWDKASLSSDSTSSCGSVWTPHTLLDDDDDDAEDAEDDVSCRWSSTVGGDSDLIASGDSTNGTASL